MDMFKNSDSNQQKGSVKISILRNCIDMGKAFSNYGQQKTENIFVFL